MKPIYPSACTLAPPSFRRRPESSACIASLMSYRQVARLQGGRARWQSPYSTLTTLDSVLRRNDGEENFITQAQGAWAQALASVLFI
jgi:hypothetical protein